MHPSTATSSFDEGDAHAFLRSVYPNAFFDFDNASSSRADKPFVTLTYAQSLDAKIAGKKGKQLVLSGRESMAMTHRLRALHTAILVGVGTVLNDDPQLNCRIPALLPPEQQPQPYILDTHARTPLTCKLLTNAQRGIGKSPIIVTGADTPRSGDLAFAKRVQALSQAGAQILALQTSAADGRVSVEALVNALPEGTRMMVEGGSAVIASFLYSGRVDRLVVTIAPVFVGEQGVPVTPAPGPSTSTGGSGGEAGTQPVLEHLASRQFGRDTVVACQVPRLELEHE